MKALSLISLFAFFASCSDKETFEKQDSETKYSFEHLLSYNREDTLFIKSKFADCGEWGGHQELIKVYSLERKIKLTYIKYKINCGIRDEKGSIIQTKDITKSFLLSKPQQAGLMNYMNGLMKLKFSEKEYGNSGNSFLVEDSRGELKFSQYGNNPDFLDNYNGLMKNLGLPEVIVRSE